MFYFANFKIKIMLYISRTGLDPEVLDSREVTCFHLKKDILTSALIKKWPRYVKNSSKSNSSKEKENPCRDLRPRELGRERIFGSRASSPRLKVELL